MPGAYKTTIITTSLGDSREITKRYPDGSWECPFCSNGVRYPATRCDNPWCDSILPAEILSAERAKREERNRRQEQLKRNHERAMERIERECTLHAQWEQEQIALARAKGACPICLFRPGYRRVHFVRHRGKCPKSAEKHL